MLNDLPRQVVTTYVGIFPSNCSTNILSVCGTRNVSSKCSSRNIPKLSETLFERPYTSLNKVRGSPPILTIRPTCLSTCNTDSESSRVLLIDSPVHEGTVGRWPVTGLTLTRVELIAWTLYVWPPSKKTSPERKFCTNDPESWPTNVPSWVNTR